mmetsp:Transcript_33094/g.65666  ORF Transcript_33094/g.65666 Transcript_33094/m.65666 type:complete len:237 (+) Transcript_33094:1809-2519(+)
MLAAARCAAALCTGLDSLWIPGVAGGRASAGCERGIFLFAKSVNLLESSTSRLTALRMCPSFTPAALRILFPKGMTPMGILERKSRQVFRRPCHLVVTPPERTRPVVSFTEENLSRVVLANRRSSWTTSPSSENPCAVLMTSGGCAAMTIRQRAAAHAQRSSFHGDCASIGLSNGRSSTGVARPPPSGCGGILEHRVENARVVCMPFTIMIFLLAKYCAAVSTGGSRRFSPPSPGR